MKAQPPASGHLNDPEDTDGAALELIETLAHLSSQVKLDKGEILFNEGDDSQTLYWVESGMLDISVLSAEGRRLTLNIARKRDILGEITMFDPGPRTATINAMEPSVLRAVAHSDILSAMKEDMDLTLALFRIAGQRMRWMNGQLMEQTTLVAPIRIARRLLYLTRHTEEELHLSQEELADFSGTTREAVSRAFKVWKNAGLIKVSRRGIQIIDRATLEVFADL